MGISLDDKLTETATKIAVTRNEYGDTVYGSTSSTVCLYRDISKLVDNINTEIVQLDGILWFGPDEDVARGDIYNHESEGYLRIETITKAKRLVVDNTRQFIKCGVTKQRQVS